MSRTFHQLEKSNQKVHVNDKFKQSLMNLKSQKVVKCHETVSS